MARHNTITFRVRYEEVDRMGVVHHSRYLGYFEQGRIELMRVLGLPHLAQEERGQPLTLKSVDVRYRAPARYDDVLCLETWIEEARAARVVFGNRLRHAESDPGDRPLAEATIVAAAIDPQGSVRRLSDEELAAFNADGPAE
jgi:acyl-CoA thioester hydrolase